jgi:NtrC-family two-component system response regulator AlgB
MPSDNTTDGEPIESLPSLRVLVVDDEPRIRDMLTMSLEDDGHDVVAVSGGAKALEAADEEAFDVVFLDLRLGAEFGMDIIPDLLEKRPYIAIIIITAHASIESTVEAMRKGAADYLPKPFSPEQVRLAMRKAADLRALEQQVGRLETSLEQAQPSDYLESENEDMQEVLSLARQVAGSEAVMLIRGESGTGKGVLARNVHGWSKRAGGPFVIVHCPSLAGELLESELFGHAKGAFTGAVQASAGRVGQAEGGTLFLDEIGDLPLVLQPKLLRFIQSQEYERVGEPQTRRADVRILAATNQDLEAAVEEGQFREDLLYRINVIEVEVPPLRKRPEDITPLAREFLSFFAEKYNRRLQGFEDETEEVLRRHTWPGNVRELRNAVERAAILSSGERVAPSDLPMKDTSDEETLPQVGAMASLDELEEAHIRRVITATATLEEAADVLGINPATLWRRRNEYGI